MVRKAFGACVAVAGLMCGLSGTAAAQDFPDQSHFQKVTLNDRPGEPMSLAVLPDGRVLHSARTGEIRLHDPRTGTNNIVTDMKASPQGLYQHDEEGVQGIALDPNFNKNKWVYVYYSPKLNTPSDVIGTGINEGDAPEDLRNAEDRARLAQFNGYALLSRFKWAATSSTSRPSRRSSGSTCPAASAATSAGRSTSTTRGTCTCPPATTRTRSSRPASRRSTTARTATRRSTRGARPATRTTCAARSCGSACATTAATTAAGQPVPSRAGATRPGDLRHGPAQPVPVRGQQDQRPRLHRRLLAGLPRRTRCAGPRAPAAG